MRWWLQRALDNTGNMISTQPMAASSYSKIVAITGLLTTAAVRKVHSYRGPKPFKREKRKKKGVCFLNLKGDELYTSIRKSVTMQTAFLSINHWSSYIKYVQGNQEEGICSLLGDS